MDTSLLRKIADEEILSSLFMKDYSLMNGQMGVSIFFAFLSRVCNNHWYEEFASELLDNVISNVNIFMPANFANGLCGIGWGIEFLAQHTFLDNDTDEILDEIDAAVMERDVRRITDVSLDTGIRGVYAYVFSRMNSKRKNPNVKPFDAMYISDLETSTLRLCGNLPVVTPNEVWLECVNVFGAATDLNWKKGLHHIFNVDDYA